MTNDFDIKKTASALICTILFSATMVLSAVGPARASEVDATKIVATHAASPVVAHLA